MQLIFNNLLKKNSQPPTLDRTARRPSASALHTKTQTTLVPLVRIAN